MMYGYTLVLMNQIGLNKQSKERNIGGHKWSLTHRVPKPYRSKTGIIYMQSWKQCVYLVITTMALWQHMYLGTWCLCKQSLFFFLQNATLEFQILLCLNKIVFSCFIVEQSISNHVSLCKVCFACWALFGSLVTAMCNRASCSQVHELPQSHCGDNREGTLFWWLHIYTRLASGRSEHPVCLGSLMTTYITLFDLFIEHSLVHWYQQCVTIHLVPKRMSCHKAIVVISGRAQCFHDCIYIYIYIYIYI